MTTPHRDRTRYCSVCGTRLVMRHEHGVPRRTCPNCGHIHYRNPVPAAGVLITDAERRVLLVKRKYAPRAGAWCLPAGFMEYGETPRHCAERELREETGLRGRTGELFGVYAGFDDPRVRAILVLYLARVTGGRLAPGDDAIDARFFAVARPPRDIAFASHRQALRELHDRLARDEAPAAPGRRVRNAAAPRPERAAGPRSRRASRATATPPRRARAARPRSRRG
jgi:ADP-ribose pyrophosphatase YjhB (NUDIX family)